MSVCAYVALAIVSVRGLVAPSDWFSCCRYSTMTYYVDQLFPPLIEAANDYSQFAYWRDPLPVVDELPEVA